MTAKYIVAVSGGVDSVCLLHIMHAAGCNIVVAHVNHGIRPDSDADEAFVKALAKHYKLPFESTRLRLGKRTSEDTARTKRYNFLFELAKKHHAKLAIAHHKEDVVESVAINLQRGTGWRGLAVMNHQAITRPLLELTKPQLYDYAVKHRLEWVEDETNATDAYQRNRVRKAIHTSVGHGQRDHLMALRWKQLTLRRAIERELDRLAERHKGSRYFLTQIDTPLAIELLAAMVRAHGVPAPTRPRLERAVHAAKTAKPGSSVQVGDGVEICFSPRTFTVKVV